MLSMNARAKGHFSILIFENLQMIMFIAEGSIANTISISMSMTRTTNLMLDDFVTFFHFRKRKIGGISN